MASAKQNDPTTTDGSAITDSPSLMGGGPGLLPSPDDDAPPTGLQPGQRLGPYEIAEKIGEGGMGLVYKANDTTLDRAVAVKVMFCGPHEERRQAQRFVREARAMARLSHPNLLHVYGVGTEGNCHYFAMELLRGETLLNAVRRLKRIPAPDLMHYLVQIISALFYVHQKGITHRDIKSGNIILCGRRAVLMDFGLAKDEADSGLTSVGAIMGTPDYMPPEAAEGRSEGPPSDIYSLGVVLYEALSGQLPFSGKSAIAIIRQHIETPPPPLEALVPEIKPELAAIIHKCLEKKPEDRYADCPALASALWEIVPEQSLLDVAEGRVPGADAIPLEQIHFGTPSNPNGPPPSRVQTRDVVSREMPAKKPSANSAAPKQNLNPTITHVDGLDQPAGDNANAETEASLATEDVAGRSGVKRAVPQWIWGVAGFLGVLLFVAILIALKRRSPSTAHPAFAGQPVVRKGAESNDKELLVEFKGGGTDPQKWFFIVRRQKPDGSWGEKLTIPYSSYVSTKTDTELIFTTDDAQRKP